jgi:hypothetical protein
VKGVRLRLRQRLRSLPSRAWSRGSELRLSIPVNLHVSGSRSFFHNKITKPAWTSYGSETKASRVQLRKKRAAKKPVQAVQYVQAVQVVESFEA